jgi:hypothetical protein
MIRLPKDWKEFTESLNSHQVEYMIVGAHALAFHGYPRYTGDIDILIRPSEENARRLENLLLEFGFASLGLSATDLLERERVIQLGLAPNRIDLLTSLTGIEFDEAWKDRVKAELDGLPVVFLGRTALIRNKRATGRAQHIADADALEQK